MGFMVIGNKSLKSAYTDRFALYTSDAFALALPLLRADTAADRRKRALLRDYLVRALNVTLCDLLNEIGYTDLYRAASHARTLFAV